MSTEKGSGPQLLEKVDGQSQGELEHKETPQAETPPLARDPVKHFSYSRAQGKGRISSDTTVSMQLELALLFILLMKRILTVTLSGFQRIMPNFSLLLLEESGLKIKMFIKNKCPDVSIS